MPSGMFEIDARPGRMLVVGGQRRPERAAGIAGGRLHPDVSEAAVAQHLAVGHAVEGYAAGEAQVLHAGLIGEAAREPQHRLLEHGLNGCGEVHVLLLEPGLRLARRPAEQAIEPRIGHGQAGAIVEVVEVEPERSVRLEIDQVVENELSRTSAMP